MPLADVALAPFTTLGVGGPARWFVTATTAQEVAEAHRWAGEQGVALFVLGGGSNLVVADHGVDGLVLQIALRGVRFDSSGKSTLLTAGAGEPWDPVVASTVERGLAGIESLSGIPGTVGGTPIQNVGAYGQEVGETIESVTVYDRQTAATMAISGTECDFAYRTSRFKRHDAERFIVCDVSFRLHTRPPEVKYPDVVRYLDEARVVRPTVADIREAVLAVRRRKGMVLDAADPDTRSVGSFFMNPIVSAADRERIGGVVGNVPPAFDMPDGLVKIPAAWLIERAGFARGESDGAVGISTKHTLALVNRGGATARDVLRLAGRIKRRVVERFGVWLRPEPVFVGFDHDPDVDYLRARSEGGATGAAGED